MSQEWNDYTYSKNGTYQKKHIASINSYRLAVGLYRWQCQSAVSPVSEIAQLHGLKKFTSMVSRGWSLLTLMITWLLLEHQQDVKSFLLLVKYLKYWMDGLDSGLALRPSPSWFLEPKVKTFGPEGGAGDDTDWIYLCPTFQKSNNCRTDAGLKSDFIQWLRRKQGRASSWGCLTGYRFSDLRVIWWKLPQGKVPTKTIKLFRTGWSWWKAILIRFFCEI